MGDEGRCERSISEAEITLTVASLRGYRTGFGLDEETARWIVIEVADEAERELSAFRDEVRLRMLAPFE